MAEQQHYSHQPAARSRAIRLLAIMVPLREIGQPIVEIRNQALLYSIAFLIFALPLYVTLVVAWIDRRLESRVSWPGSRDD